jgi:hypothetical protein
VPVDGSPASIRALKFALDLRKSASARGGATTTSAFTLRSIPPLPLPPRASLHGISKIGLVSVWNFYGRITTFGASISLPIQAGAKGRISPAEICLAGRSGKINNKEKLQ